MKKNQCIREKKKTVNRKEDHAQLLDELVLGALQELDQVHLQRVTILIEKADAVVVDPSGVVHDSEHGEVLARPLVHGVLGLLLGKLVQKPLLLFFVFVFL